MGSRWAWRHGSGLSALLAVLTLSSGASAGPLPPSVAELTAVAPRDARAAVRNPRSRAVVEAEVAALQDALAHPSPGHPPAVHLLRRLARNHHELAARSFREADEAEGYARDEPQPDPVKAAQARARAQRARHDASAPLRAAVAAYRRLLADHAPWCQEARSEICAETAYHLGLAHEQLGERAEAKARYGEVLLQWARSSYVPAAYFGLGQLELELASRAPARREFARTYLEATAWHLGTQNPLAGFATFILGQMELAEGDVVEAERHFLRLREHCLQHPAQPGSRRLAAEAELALAGLGIPLP